MSCPFQTEVEQVLKYVCSLMPSGITTEVCVISSLSLCASVIVQCGHCTAYCTQNATHSHLENLRSMGVYMCFSLWHFVIVEDASYIGP